METEGSMQYSRDNQAYVISKSYFKTHIKNSLYTRFKIVLQGKCENYNQVTNSFVHGT